MKGKKDKDEPNQTSRTPPKTKPPNQKQPRKGPNQNATSSRSLTCLEQTFLKHWQSDSLSCCGDVEPYTSQKRPLEGQLIVQMSRLKLCQ